MGQDAIHLVAAALGVPLYRRVISGGAIELGSEYGSRNATDVGGVQGDETEDMYALLSTVKVNLQISSLCLPNLVSESTESSPRHWRCLRRSYTL